jgi:hypothetical protein
MSTSATPSKQAGLVEDFVDIFVSPSAVYERRRNSTAWLPLIVVSVVVGLAYLAMSGAMQPIIDAEFERGMKQMLESNSGMTAEQLQQGRAFAQGIGKVAIVAGTPIAIFLCGVGLLLMGKLFDSPLKLGTNVMIAAWAFVPRIIGSVLVAAQLQFLAPESLDGAHRISLGPARFLDPDTTSAMLLALASRLDVFILWTTLLFAIGLSVVARIPRSNALVAAAGVWACGTFFALYGAIR